MASHHPGTYLLVLAALALTPVPAAAEWPPVPKNLKHCHDGEEERRSRALSVVREAHALAASGTIEHGDAQDLIRAAAQSDVGR